MMAIILANTFVTRYGFINTKFAKKVYQIFEIKSQCLIKQKQIQKFNSKAAKFITYVIYPILTMDTYIKSLALLFIIKLGNYLMIFS